MKKIKHAMLFMGIGVMGTIIVMKMMDSDCCDKVDDLMCKEKKMLKKLKKKMFN